MEVDGGSQVEVCGEDACFLRSSRAEDLAVYPGVKPGIIEKIGKATTDLS